LEQLVQALLLITRARKNATEPIETDGLSHFEHSVISEKSNKTLSRPLMAANMQIFVMSVDPGLRNIISFAVPINEECESKNRTRKQMKLLKFMGHGIIESSELRTTADILTGGMTTSEPITRR